MRRMNWQGMKEESWGMMQQALLEAQVMGFVPTLLHSATPFARVQGIHGSRPGSPVDGLGEAPVSSLILAHHHRIRDSPGVPHTSNARDSLVLPHATLFCANCAQP